MNRKISFQDDRGCLGEILAISKPHIIFHITSMHAHINGHWMLYVLFVLYELLKSSQSVVLFHYPLMLLSQVCKYAYEWAYECNSAEICNDCKKFVGVCKCS